MCLSLITNHNLQIIFLLTLTIFVFFVFACWKLFTQHFLHYLWTYYWEQLYTIIWHYKSFTPSFGITPQFSLFLMTFFSRGLSIKYVNLYNPNLWTSFSPCTYLTKEWFHQNNRCTLLIQPPLPLTVYILYGWPLVEYYQVKFPLK